MAYSGRTPLTMLLRILTASLGINSSGICFPSISDIRHCTRMPCFYPWCPHQTFSCTPCLIGLIVRSVRMLYATFFHAKTQSCPFSMWRRFSALIPREINTQLSFYHFVSFCLIRFSTKSAFPVDLLQSLYSAGWLLVILVVPLISQ